MVERQIKLILCLYLIGKNGPFKKPLFINVFSLVETIVDSTHHPKKDNIIK